MLETKSLQRLITHPAMLNRHRRSSNLITKTKINNLSSTIRPLSPRILNSRCRGSDSWLSDNTVGIIGGLSTITTLIFLEKIVFWSTRIENRHVPFILCSGPEINEEVSSHRSVLCDDETERVVVGLVADNLMRRRVLLEECGARCIVMPCHVSHLWYEHVARGCSVPFLDVGECVARELREANLRPVEAGGDVRVGVLAAHSGPVSEFYRDRLQSQGFECILPDKHTKEQMVNPMLEALNQKDMEGARNLLRIAVHVLLLRGVNVVILAGDEFQGILPCDDPLLKKCIDPMDSLARSAIKWAQSKPIIHH